MVRCLAALLAAALLVPSVAPDVPAAKTHTVALNGHTFTLPAGFTIELAAQAPLVDRPIAADLDDEGRLFVADSSGSNEKVQEQLKKRPHRVVRLEDRNGDGAYDRGTVFADRMMFPEGVLCRDGDVYVAAPPSIWKLTDADGDGVAEKRAEWFEGKTLTGCANDLHGPYSAPDGRIYWCKGAFAEQRHPRPGRKDLVTKASHIFRARPDGGGIEAVMTGGMDNPVDVVFLPSGERIFTTTFFQHPGGGLRDGLIHNVYGGVWGKEHNVLDGHPRTGPGLMPVLTHMGAAAPAGLHRYESAAFGAEYRDNLFAAQFNLAKVSRHVLTPHGATFRCRDEDFLVSANRDFHPTDVIEDADGSLLIIDTGGWYKLCCPTSQLSKPDVLGAVYRVRRQGAAKPADPRGEKIAWAKAPVNDLAKLLGDERPVVRRRATAALAARGEGSLPALRDTIREAKSAEARRNAVWAATRLDHAGARAAVRLGLADADETVRQAALHSAALWRDRGATDALLKLLAARSAHNRRGAAEALGRAGDARAVPALLEALAGPVDRVLEHSLIFALMEINDRESTAKGLRSRSPAVRRAALVALAGMDDGRVTAEPVVKELTAPDARLREAAWWVAGERPGWGADVAGHLKARLAAAKGGERDELAGHLARLSSSEAIQSLIADRLAGGTAAEKRLVLRAMAAARLKALPAKWDGALLGALAGDAGLIADAVGAARQLPLSAARTPKVLARLRQIAADESLPAETRAAALAAVPSAVGALDGKLYAFLCSCVGKDRPVAQRGPAAAALAQARLSEAQLSGLAGLLRAVGPMELEPLLEPFARGKGEKIGLALVEGLQASPARSALQPDRLRARLKAYPESVRKAAERLIGELDADRERRMKQIEDLLPLAKKGDVRRGQAVFNSQKTACAACHAIGYLGGKIGPDLTHIGKVRDERDLLESILFPSASFVRSYEPVQVTTTRGQVHNGLVRSDGGDELVLTVSATEQARIAKKEIEEVRPGKVSVMPAGLDKALTAQELADLVAFLKACK